MKKKHSETWWGVMLGLIGFVIFISGIKFYTSYDALGTALNSGEESRDLNELTAGEITENMWIKTELTTLIDYYVYREITWKKNGRVDSTTLRYSYFVPVYDEDGNLYYLTVYSNDGQQYSFEQQARNNRSTVKIKEVTIPYQGRTIALPEEEYQDFQNYLMNAGFSEEEADAVILPYVLEPVVIDNSKRNTIISAVVFLCALLGFIILYRKRTVQNRMEAEEQKKKLKDLAQVENK